MIRLHDAERGTLIGTITEAQLQFLIDELEEESAEDSDYYVSADTIDMLEEDGGAPSGSRRPRRDGSGQV
jgi:hypothetical protein